MSNRLTSFYARLSSLGLIGVAAQQWHVADRNLISYRVEESYLIYKPGQDQFLIIQDHTSPRFGEVWSPDWSAELGRWIRKGSGTIELPTDPNRDKKDEIWEIIEQYRKLPTRWVGQAGTEALTNLPIRCQHLRALQAAVPEYALVFTDLEDFALEEITPLEYTEPLGHPCLHERIMPKALFPQGLEELDPLRRATVHISVAGQLVYSIPSITHYTYHTWTESGEVNVNIERFIHKLAATKKADLAAMDIAYQNTKVVLAPPPPETETMSTELDLA